MKHKSQPPKAIHFKQTLKGFVKDEAGFVAKDKILKVGLGTVTALGVISSLINPAYSQHHNRQHAQGHSGIAGFHHTSVSEHDNNIYAIRRQNATWDCFRLSHYNQPWSFTHSAGTK